MAYVVNDHHGRFISIQNRQQCNNFFPVYMYVYMYIFIYSAMHHKEEEEQGRGIREKKRTIFRTSHRR